MSQNEMIMLDEAATKRLIKAVGTNLEQILWLADWLLHLNVFSDTPRVTTVCVCDSRWVSISGAASFLDTQTSEVVEQLPQAAVTHIFCDLAALQLRMEHRKRKFNGPQPATQKPAQASSDKSTEQTSGPEDDSAHTADV